MSGSQSLPARGCYTELGFSFAAQTSPGRTKSVALRNFCAHFPARIRRMHARKLLEAQLDTGSIMSSSRIHNFLFCLLLAFSLCSTNQVASQDSAMGAIRGTVFDSSGGRVGQASIVVVDAATGARFTASSDAEGRFGLELLPPGDYSARVEAQNMSPQVTPQLHVDVGGTAEVEFRLTVASAQETVTVSARQRSWRLSRVRFRRCSMSAQSTISR